MGIFLLQDTHGYLRIYKELCKNNYIFEFYDLEIGAYDYLYVLIVVNKLFYYYFNERILHRQGPLDQYHSTSALYGDVWHSNFEPDFPTYSFIRYYFDDSHKYLRLLNNHMHLFRGRRIQICNYFCIIPYRF